MKNNIKNLSIIMTVYNGEKYISDAIESILDQTYSDFEFIIIDDKSIDASYSICQKYASQDNRIRLYRNHKNLWVVKSRNILLSKISHDSKYVAILDADDIADIYRMEKQVEFLEQNLEYSIVGSALNIINQSGQLIWQRIYPHTDEEISQSIFKKSPVAQPAVMIRKNDLDKIGNYDENFERCQDYDLWCRAFDSGYKIINIPDLLTFYRVYSEQWKSKHVKLSLKNTIKIQKKYIFQKKYFSFSNLLYFFAENILAIFPSKVILYIFKKITY